MEIRLKELLKLYSKDELQELLDYFDLKTSGNKKDLIERILSNNLPGLDLVLFESFLKDGLIYLCNKLGLKSTGNKNDLETAIREIIIIPDRYISDCDEWEINDDNKLQLSYFDIDYIFSNLSIFYGVEELKDICYDHDLQISGNKDDLLERIQKNIDLRYLLEYTEDDFIEDICEELTISFIQNDPAETISKILEIIDEGERKKGKNQQKIIQESTPSTPIQKKYTYDVAISFAGEDRDYVEKLKTALQNRYVKVFYDNDEKANLWGKNLVECLSNVYSGQSRYCIIVISKNYNEKQWTRLERRSAQERAFKDDSEYILPLKLDDTKIPGILETIAFIDSRQHTVEEIAEMLFEKLRQP